MQKHVELASVQCSDIRSHQAGKKYKKTLGCNPLLPFRKLRSLYITIMAFVEGVRCPSFHTHIFGPFRVRE